MAILLSKPITGWFVERDERRPTRARHFCPRPVDDGIDMVLLRRRVRYCGFIISQFSYPSIRCNSLKNVTRLSQVILGTKAAVIHLVGHSLGGLVIRHCLYELKQWQQLHCLGRVVTLGTPHQGSIVAQRLADQPLLRHLLGHSISQGLDGDLPPWPEEIALGIIAGTRPLGIGQLLGGIMARVMARLL